MTRQQSSEDNSAIRDDSEGALVEEESSLSFRELPIYSATQETKPLYRQESYDLDDPEDFTFTPCYSYFESGLCVADDVFFQGRIIPSKNMAELKPRRVLPQNHVEGLLLSKNTDMVSEDRYVIENSKLKRREACPDPKLLYRQPVRQKRSILQHVKFALFCSPIIDFRLYDVQHLPSRDRLPPALSKARTRKPVRDTLNRTRREGRNRALRNGTPLLKCCSCSAVQPTKADKGTSF